MHLYFISLYFVTFCEFRYVSFYVIEKGFCYRWRAIAATLMVLPEYILVTSDRQVVNGVIAQNYVFVFRF